MCRPRMLVADSMWGIGCGAEHDDFNSHGGRDRGPGHRRHIGDDRDCSAHEFGAAVLLRCADELVVATGVCAGLVWPVGVLPVRPLKNAS